MSNTIILCYCNAMKKTIILLIMFNSLMLSNTISQKLYQDKCAGCHGFKANKKAFGKSRMINGWNKTKLQNVLNGYEENSFKDHLKNVMKKQIQVIKDHDKELIIDYIDNLKP